MDERSKVTRAAAGGAFGAALAVVTGGTLIGIAIVAALGAGLAAKSGAVASNKGERADVDRRDRP